MTHACSRVEPARSSLPIARKSACAIRVRARTSLAALIVACAAIAGCGRENSGDAGDNPRVTEAVLKYGYGPQPHPKVRYQPDVILMPGGPEIIRGVSEDGVTWILDADAERVRDLVPGKIMFASTRAVGRVMEVQPSGGNVAVTVLPVQLTEVIRDADLKIETTLATRPVEAAYENHSDTDKSIHEQGLFAGPYDGQFDARPRLMRASWAADDVQFLRVATETDSNQVAVSNPFFGAQVQPFIKFSESKSDTKQGSVREIGVKVANNDKRFKVGASVSLYGSNIRVRANIIIVDGEVKESSSFVIDGVEGLNIGIVSGAEKAIVVKGRLEDVWVDEGKTFLVYGVPIAVSLKIKTYMELAFSGGNSTITANGGYKLSGEPIGYENGAFHKPTLTVDKPMMQSIGGVTIAPVGVVAATEFRVLIGFGDKRAAVMGHYGKVVVSVGVSRGSALGLPLADCHGVTLKIDAGHGWGIDFNKKITTLFHGRWRSPAIDRIREQIGKKKFELDIGGADYNIFQRTSVEPNIPLCGGGA